MSSAEGQQTQSRHTQEHSAANSSPRKRSRPCVSVPPGGQQLASCSSPTQSQLLMPFRGWARFCREQQGETSQDLIETLFMNDGQLSAMAPL
eukprot:1820806-Pleurochrysis_carterae.AAC.1